MSILLWSIFRLIQVRLKNLNNFCKWITNWDLCHMLSTRNKDQNLKLGNWCHFPTTFSQIASMILVTYLPLNWIRIFQFVTNFTTACNVVSEMNHIFLIKKILDVQEHYYNLLDIYIFFCFLHIQKFCIFRVIHLQVTRRIRFFWFWASLCRLYR